MSIKLDHAPRCLGSATAYDPKTPICAVCPYREPCSERSAKLKEEIRREYLGELLARGAAIKAAKAAKKARVGRRTSKTACTAPLHTGPTVMAEPPRPHESSDEIINGLLAEGIITKAVGTKKNAVGNG